MPRATDLPDSSLKKLVRRHYIEVSHSRFDSDVESLTRTLSSMLDERRQREAARAVREGREKRDAAKTEKTEPARRSAEAEAARTFQARR